MKKTERFEYKLNIAGHTQDLFFDPHVSSCGSIIDGVILRFSNDGGFVLSYDDLFRMFTMATEKRLEKNK